MDSRADARGQGRTAKGRIQSGARDEHLVRSILDVTDAEHKTQNTRVRQIALQMTPCAIKRAIASALPITNTTLVCAGGPRFIGRASARASAPTRYRGCRLHSLHRCGTHCRSTLLRSTAARRSGVRNIDGGSYNKFFGVGHVVGFHYLFGV